LRTATHGAETALSSSEQMMAAATYLESPMPDPFSSDYVNLTSPAVAHYVVTPSDSADLPVRPRAIFVQGAGTAALQDRDGQVVTYDLAAGAVLSIRPVRVLASGTTAQLVAWY
jgi:hypothetical protein